MTSILVAGGAGYIGSSTCRALAEAGFLPITYDNLSRGFRKFARFGPFAEGDILDADRIAAVVRTYKPAACIHFAAFAYVGESMADPLAYYQNNVVGTVSLLRTLLENGVRNVVFSSSCATYGVPDRVPISEDCPQRPVSAYGTTKLTGEHILRDLDSAHGLSSVSLRYFNASGAHADATLGPAHQPQTRAIPLAILAALGESPGFDIFGTDYPTRDGTAVRDYVHVTDLAAAHVLALRYLLDEGPSTAFNIGTGRGYSVREVVRSVERISARSFAINEAPRRPGDPPELVADPQKAMTVLGFRPRYTTLDSIVETALRWHLASRNPDLAAKAR